MMDRLEALKLWRSRRPLIAVASVISFLGLMLLGFYTYAASKLGDDVDFHYTFENESYFNGLTFALYAFYFGTLLVLPIFAATEGGAQLAGETSSGTIFLLMTRPISRARIFLAKLRVMALLALGLVGVLLFSSLALGLLFVGWGELNLYPGVLQMTERHQYLTQSEALRAFLIAWPAATVALFAPMSLSLMISSYSRNPINAVGTAVSLYLILYVIAEVHLFETLRPWLFTSYMSYWRGLFREEIDWGECASAALRLAGFGFLFLAVAFHRFRTREEA